MDDDIKKETKSLNEIEIASILEYKPQMPPTINIVNERDDNQYDDVQKRINKIKQISESRGTEHPYPWEDLDYDNNEDMMVSSTEPKKDYVKTTYYLTTSGTEINENNTEKRVIIKSNPLAIIGAKYKGKKTVIISTNGQAYSTGYGKLHPSPIADRAKAAIEIANIKRDPGYKRWSKAIAKLNTRGTDSFLYALYDLCVDIKCSFRDMMYVIAAECSFDKDKPNSSTGATGLIQWHPDNWSRMGFPSGGPKRLSGIDQIPYIKKYYENRDYYKEYKNKFGTGIPNLIAQYTFVAGGNTYLPFSRFNKRNFRIYPNVKGNPGWDYTGDGQAYAWEITDYAIRRWYGTERGQKLPSGNLYSPDNVTIGMKIWNLQTKSLTPFGKTLLSNEINGIEMSPGFRNL
jgi:hypothetical protein